MRIQHIRESPRLILPVPSFDSTSLIGNQLVLECIKLVPLVLLTQKQDFSGIYYLIDLFHDHLPEPCEIPHSVH